MRIILLSFCVLIAAVHSSPTPQVTDLPNYTKLTAEELRSLQNRGFGPTVPSFRPTVAYEEAEEEYEDSEPESSQDRHQAYPNANVNYQPQTYQVPLRVAHPKVQPTPKPERKIAIQQTQYRRGEAVVSDVC